MPPKPSHNPPWNPNEREEILTLDAAIAMFEPEFPDKPVRRSLTKMKLEFRRALTPHACREWLQREREAKKVRTIRTSSWDEAAPAAAGQVAVDAKAPPEPPTGSLSSSWIPSMELEFINPAEIDRERFDAFVAKCHYQHIASWTPYSAPQAVLRQFLAMSSRYE